MGTARTYYRCDLQHRSPRRLSRAIACAALLLALLLPRVALGDSELNEPDPDEGPASQDAQAELVVELSNTDPDRVVEIRFEGNDVTKARVIRRRMLLRVGDMVTADAAEQDRQSIQDLGLFESVDVRAVQASGGVSLVFTVEERWYLLPIPRIDFNSDQELSLGMDVEWFNLWGLNHTAEALYTVKDTAEEEIGDETRYQVSYYAPLVFDSVFDVSVSARHLDRPVNEPSDAMGVPDFDNEEREAEFRAEVFRNLGERRRGIGWRLGAGLHWSDQRRDGPVAREQAGMATAVRLEADYRNRRDQIFSFEGMVYGASVEYARDGVLSDYSYTEIAAFYRHDMPIGKKEHQTFALIANLNSYHGGPGIDPRYTLGGGSDLRAFDKGSFEGDAKWSLTAEYQRPVFGTRSVAALALIDVGAAHDEWDQARARDIHVDLGIGLRWRVQALVDFAIEIGYAVALTDSDAKQAFGGRVE